ncbi:MAG: hypothetical protein Q4G25_02980 [Paracoccus sp. (in: a-proteobacteria)]|nr:hypothetical protein [Paracoccus sp. (in: a-proteobacteria)]
MASRTIIERQWVPTGAGFALSHPLAQTLGPVWLLVGWCGLAGLAALGWNLWILLHLGQIWQSGAMFFTVALIGLALNLTLFLAAALAVPFLVLRRPQAVVPVWIALILTLPFSIPMMMWWADGVRPNLIYRHRFARLVEVDYAVP